MHVLGSPLASCNDLVTLSQHRPGPGTQGRFFHSSQASLSLWQDGVGEGGYEGAVSWRVHGAQAEGSRPGSQAQARQPSPAG